MTLFYSGLSPKAPGTVGSLVALILAMVSLEILNISNIFMIAFLVTLIGVKQIDIYEKEVQTHDGKEIVIDEFAGMWVALSVAGVGTSMWLMGFIAFIYFRIFDIWKPSIIGRIDRNVKGGWGVMGDDLLAGFFAGLCTSLTYHLLEVYLF